MTGGAWTGSGPRGQSGQVLILASSRDVLDHCTWRHDRDVVEVFEVEQMRIARRQKGAVFDFILRSAAVMQTVRSHRDPL